MSGCDPKDVAIKSFFTGPQAENGEWLKRQWSGILEHWLKWRSEMFAADGRAITESDLATPEFQEARGKLERSLSFILRELEKETPKFTPRYIGHMVSEVSLPAMLGHVCALLHNPNNTSREVSKVTSRLEDEAIKDLAVMTGLGEDAEGHFTSGGTLANFEALWRALVRLDRGLSGYLENFSGGQDFMRAVHSETSSPGDGDFSLLELGPWEFAKRFRERTGREFSGPVILVPGNKHYSWEKAAVMMGLGNQAFWPVELDEWGRLDPSDLKRKIELAKSSQRPIALVVSVAGTTELGQVDPVDEVAAILEDLRRSEGIDLWHHVDAAYGGYFCGHLRGTPDETLLAARTQAALTAIGRADSVTLDPHKLGYVPYSCGAFLARDARHYQTYSPSAPYLQRKNKSRWLSTIEGSRGGSGATATWLSNRVMGLDRQGYGRLLEKGLEAREHAMAEISARFPHAIFAAPPDLNIVCFCLAQKGESLSAVNRRSFEIFEAFERSPHFSISRTVLDEVAYKRLIRRVCLERGLVQDEGALTMLRLVLMNPFVLSKETDFRFIPEFAAELQVYDKMSRR